MKSESARKVITVFSTIAACFTHVLSYSGPSLRVVEYTERGGIETHSIPAPQNKGKPLTKRENGKTLINWDSASIYESKAYEALRANFEFPIDCDYQEYEEFYRRHHSNRPEKEVLVLFNNYLLANKPKLRSREECFTESIQKLLKAHPCIENGGTIEFHVQKLAKDAVFRSRILKDGKPDQRRVVAVSVLGCPFKDLDEANEKAESCTYFKDQENPGDFLTSRKMSNLATACVAEYQKDTLKKLANAVPNQAHGR